MWKRSLIIENIKLKIKKINLVSLPGELEIKKVRKVCRERERNDSVESLNVE